MYKRILVPLDGSQISECSLNEVKNMARGIPDVEVILLTVQEEILPFTSIPFAENRAQEMAAQREKMKDDVSQKIEKYLSDVSSSLRQEGITVETMIEYPDPLKSIAEIIMDFADASQAELIVMSSHGRTGIKRWAMGSVADRVVRYSKIPVLVVPAAACRI